jgi:DMSO reductase anchor subunit
MNRHKSLVAFTLLIQSAIGSVWCIGIALLRGDNPLSYGWHADVALLFVITGLCFSIGHLGKPGICFYAIRNIRHSWLSREIAASVTFAAALTVMTFTSLWPGGLNVWVVLAASVIGGFALYAMAKAYRLRTVPSWNHGGTVLDFLGSALLLGGLQFTVVSDVLIAVTGSKSDFTGPAFSGYTGLFVALVGFLFKLPYPHPARSHAKATGMPFDFSQSILQGVGIVLWVASVISEYSYCIELAFLLLAAAFMMMGETIRRIRFYGSYSSAGL